MFRTKHRLTDRRTDTTPSHGLKRLAIIALVVGIALAGIAGASGAAMAHPGTDDGDDDSDTDYHEPGHEHGVEDHGYYPAEGVQEGPLSDGYGGYMGGL